MKAAEKNAKRRAHYNHLERAVDAEAAKRFHEPTYSQRIPHYVKQVYEQLELAAGLSGFEIAGLRGQTDPARSITGTMMGYMNKNRRKRRDHD